MLTGQLPTGGESDRHAMTDGAGIPPGIARALSRCLAREPELRPQSAAEVLQSLAVEASGANPERQNLTRSCRGSDRGR